MSFPFSSLCRKLLKPSVLELYSKCAEGPLLFLFISISACCQVTHYYLLSKYHARGCGLNIKQVQKSSLVNA